MTSATLLTPARTAVEAGRPSRRAAGTRRRAGVRPGPGGAGHRRPRPGPARRLRRPVRRRGAERLEDPVRPGGPRPGAGLAGLAQGAALLRRPGARLRRRRVPAGQLGQPAAGRRRSPSPATSPTSGVSRGFLGISFAVGTVGLEVARFAARKRLHRARCRGAGWSRKVLVVGDTAHVLELVHTLRREPYAGYQVVGACIPDALLAPVPQRLGDVPVVGSFRGIPEAATAIGADTVAVTASGELTATRLRRLGWQLEGTGVDLVVAPGADRRGRPAHPHPAGRRPAADPRRGARVPRRPQAGQGLRRPVRRRRWRWRCCCRCWR